MKKNDKNFNELAKVSC